MAHVFVRVMANIVARTAMVSVAATAAASQSQSQSLTLRADAMVASHEVRMSDLVAVDGLTAGTARLLEDHVVAPAPMLGQVLRIDRGTVQRQLSRWGMSATLTGAAFVAVRRTPQQVDASTLCDAVTEALRQALPSFSSSSVTFSLRCAQASSVEVGSGPLALRALVDASSVLDGHKEIAVELRVAQRMERVARVPVEVSLQAFMWCAGEGIAAGQRIVEGSFLSCRRPVQRLDQLHAVGSTLPAGRLKHALRSGELLGAADVADSALQLRGDPVTIVYRAGALALESPGRLSQDGRVGETVRVQMAAGASVVGRLATGTLVEVEEQP